MTTFSCVKLICFFSAIFLFCSCDSSRRINRDYLYFQHDRDIVVRSKTEELTIKPNDVLIIQIYSNTLNQEQVALYNLTTAQGYTVGLDGKIQLPGPGLGEMVVAGQTRDQLQKNLRTKLLPYVKDPGVIVKFQQITINVLGDVAGPGTKVFPKDQVTILDAIGVSGDLLPTGRRDNVTVIRDNNGVKQIYEIDLRSAALFESPVYQLQQNDIVYVNANKTKLRAAKDSKTDVGKILQFAFSAVGVLTSLFFVFRNN